ncbi:MAG: enolase C-terminal domain-like protein, partial [Chloroflexota bacterium]
EDVYNAGVRVLKVKTGKDFEREYDLIRQIRTAWPGMDCYIDANETYTLDTAPETLAAFAELGVLYCEEPLPVHHLRERAAVRAADVLPIIGDDSCFTPADLDRELDFDTFDILNIKPPRNGFTDGLAMAQRALSAGKGVMMGSQASSILGCIHTLMLAGVDGVAHPSEGTFWLKVDDEAALPVVDGYVRMDDLIEAHWLQCENIHSRVSFGIDRTAWALLYGEEPAAALASLMHEMRNTLTGIKGGIDIANTIVENATTGTVIKGFAIEDIPQFLTMTARNAEQLATLINEIMHLRRLEPSSHFLKSLAEQIPLDHRTAEFVRLIQDDFQEPVSAISTTANFIDYDLRQGNPESLGAFVDVLQGTADRMANNLSLYADVLKKLQTHPAFRYHLTEQDATGFQHKVGNIVTVLKSYGSLLLNYADRLPPARVHENTAIVVESASRIEDVMEKLQLLLQINAGTLSRNDGPFPFDWAEAAERVTKWYQASIERRNISLHVHVVPALPGLLQSEHLFYLVRELVHNAVQATGEDGTITVNVSTGGEGAVLLCVQDDGRGIPPGDRAHIGERWRGGVGLFIAYRIVTDVYGGNIWFESNETAGTTFFVSLPTGK